MTFEEWINQPVPSGVRYGQHLMNTAPQHIYNTATGDLKLDCFYADEGDPRILTFIHFAQLVWDDTDETTLKLARQIV